MRSEEESHQILQRALDAARSDEADAVFIAVDQNISRFANSNLHQNMSEESAELTLRVINRGRAGVASTTLFNADELARTAELAREAARHSDPLQKFTGLYRNGAQPPLRTFDAATRAISPAAKATALREMFDRGHDAGVDFAGSYSTLAASVACANTHGVRRFAEMTFADASVIALHRQASGFATACARAAADLNVLDLGREAAEKATLRLDRFVDLEPGPYDVILEPPALAEVFEWLTMIAFTGQSFEEESSFFAGRLGEKVVGENITIVDDALDESFLPFPFDLEGLPKRRVPIIERGVARTPLLDKAWADRLELEPTGNAWDLGSADHGTALHLALEGGDASREAMIASTRRGIWVTRFNYVNGLLEPKTALMTGTTRDGTFLIEDGEVTGRLPNLRWTQSIVEALSNVEALSRERRRVATWFNMFGGTIAPVAKIRGWHFTGKQETTTA